MMAPFILRLLAVFGLLGFVLAIAAQDAPREPATYLRHQRRAMEKRAMEKKHYTYKRSNVTSSSLAEAQRLVDEAVAQQGTYNSYRVANPRRNNYFASNAENPTSATKRMRKRDDEPSLPVINSTVSAAAALLAEHHAAQQAANGTLHKIYRRQPPPAAAFEGSRLTRGHQDNQRTCLE